MTETKHAHPVTVIPYLSFRGNCEEALNTYIEAFGGEIFTCPVGAKKHTMSLLNR